MHTRTHTYTHTYAHTHTAESEPSLGLEVLWMSFIQTPNSKMLESAATNGSAPVLAKMLKKSPEQVSVNGTHSYNVKCFVTYKPWVSKTVCVCM